MAEDEKKEEGEGQAGGAGGLMSGTRGWIIVLAVVVLEAVFFIVVMQLNKRKNEPDKQGEVTKPKVGEVLQRKVELTELNYSIPTGHQSKILSMDLVIVLEKWPSETASDVTLSEEDMEKFHQAVLKMEPLIKDWLMNYIGRQTASVLESPRGKQMIRDFVKEKANAQLEQIDLELSEKELLKRRVTRVLIPRFFMQ